jgi:DNA (cytosine-5)-methyltransferase 1
MNVPEVIKKKIRRLAAHHPPRFMDLFAGCGGLTLGFATAGFVPVATVELDEHAAASHGANFARISLGRNLDAYRKARDVTTEDPATIFKDLGIDGPVDAQVDVLVGGPPCQAFARIGRAKLRHEARRRLEDDADLAFLVDGRVNLWRPYLHYVRETKPVAILMENVPDILNHGGKNVAETVAQHLREEGYRVRYTLLNAAWYGVPQVRERMFMIGVHEALDADPLFPTPTHFADLPSGYEGTRATARKHILASLGQAIVPEHNHRWVADPRPDQGLPCATTASEALADLPPIFAMDLLRNGGIRRGRKDPSVPCEYICSNPTTAWSNLMRRWPAFETGDHTSGHLIRFLPRDYKVFRMMEEGWQYPDVWRFIERERNRLLQVKQKQGKHIDRRTPEGKAFYREWTLPYDPNKFPNKWWKLRQDAPVRTLMAHLGKDSYSHIHYDSEQARTISIREAARLQSLPDGFALCGSMNSALKQIGNAVPALLAYAIAMAIRDVIGCSKIRDIRPDLLGLDPRLITTTAGST